MSRQRLLLSLAISQVLAALPALADESSSAARNAEAMDTIVVWGKRVQDSQNVDEKSRAVIEREMIRDTRDLVRYTSDVGISDNGRHLKGFAIRGVEGNRVGISVDGIALPDFEENSLYNRYGNFNNSRLSVDPELVRSIGIVKGADSFASGSGSLGGRIDYRTLEGSDLVAAGKRHGGLWRSGYASRNREWVNTAGYGFSGEKLEGILMYSQRYGHEMTSTGEGPYYNYTRSQHPDPATHRFHNYLGKLRWQFAPEHSLGLAVNGQRGSNYTDERSYTLFGSQWREADDQNRRINGNLRYQWQPEAGALERLQLDADYQNTDLAAVSYKGGRNWSTDEKELLEIFDRRMKTRYRRFTLGLQSRVLENPDAQMQFEFRVFAAQRHFENVNVDSYPSFGSSTAPYAIQYPIRTRQLGFSLQDDIRWNNGASVRAGLRFDKEQLEPLDLSIACSAACTAEGRPKESRFGNWSGFVDVLLPLGEHWQLGYNLGSGFRVPTASEMYFTFKSPYGEWQSNPDLKAERSITHNLSLHGNGQLGTLALNLYQSNYRDFLYEQESVIRTRNPYYDSCAWYGCSEYNEALKMQMVNIDRARIRGVDLNARWNIGSVVQSLPGWWMSAALGYSRGKLFTDHSLLSIQPIKGVLGLDYESPDGRWAVFSRVSYLGRKKPEDAQVVENVWSWATQSHSREVTTYKYLNRAVTLFDVYGYYRLGESWTVRAGIYNAFDRRYQTWDALRGINAHSVMNTVDRDGLGLERFYAPGRNFALSLEYLF